MRRLFTLLIASLTGVSCALKPASSAEALLPPRARIVAIDDVDGPVKVDISLSSMTAQLLSKDNALLAEMDISPGMDNTQTPCGTYRISEKMLLKRSNLYGQYVRKDTREVVIAKHWEHAGPKPAGTVYQGIAMPYWMRLTADGVGIHVGAFARGQATSKGCIRCPEEGQTFFYQHCGLGTYVKIHSGAHPAGSVLNSQQ